MRLALWQTTGFPAAVESNLRALEQTARSAGAASAELLLCPECWLCGYNIGSAVAGLAQTRDGPAACRIAAIAREHGLAIAYGYAERDPTSGRVYNSVQVMGAGGQPLAGYRKTHLFGPDERAAYEPGTQLEPLFTFADFKVGLLVCYDVEYPEAVRSLALLGAELILVPTALPAEYTAIPDFVVPARSVENQLFIAYCNRAGVENGLRFLGRSCLTGPDGKSVAAAGAGETLLIADISRSTIQAAVQSYPYLKDRRPELYGRVTARS